MDDRQCSAVEYSRAGQGFVDAAKAAGVPTHLYTGDATTTSYATGIEQALAQHAAGFALSGIPVKTVATPLQKATSQNTPFVNYVTQDYGQPLLFGDFASVTWSFTEEGKLAGYGILQATNCNAHVLALTFEGSPSQVAVTNGTKAAISQLCPSCVVNTENVPLTDSPAQVQQVVQTELTRYPDTNFVAVENDATALAALPAVKQAGLRESGAGCDPSVYKYLAAHDTLAIDVCPPAPEYSGWVTFDELARAVLGLPSATFPLPLQYVGPQTPFSAQNPFPEFGDYQSAFKTLWGLSG